MIAFIKSIFNLLNKHYKNISHDLVGYRKREAETDKRLNSGARKTSGRIIK